MERDAEEIRLVVDTNVLISALLEDAHVLRTIWARLLYLYSGT